MLRFNRGSLWMRSALVAGFLVPVLAANAVEEDSDALFLRARSLPKERREEARALCRQALQRSPDYHEIRVYLARLHAWDGQYDDARRELAYVLERKPGDLEAREVAIDVEAWSDHPKDALRMCEEGLRITPESAVLHYRKARLLKAAGDLQTALTSVQAALALDPDHQPSRLLRDDLKELTQRSKVSMDLTYETFDSTFDPWKTVSMSLGHRFDLGSVTLRVNRVERFDTWGTQVEIDAYPRIVEGTYVYLNLGHSDDSIFPSSSSGAELYHNFPHGIEASLGLRHLVFDSSSVTIYTGSIGKYHGNALYTLRLNGTPSEVGTSYSGSLMGRWYLADSDNYISATVGAGFSPEQFAWSEDVVLMHSRKASVGIQRKLGRSWIISSGVGWNREEIRPDVYRTHWTFSAGLEKRF